MRRCFVLFAVCCLLMAAADADAQRRGRDDGTKPGLSFRVAEYDFGEIAESGRKVSYDYVFTNTGNCPLVITRAITSCKCVDVEYNKRPVPPGGQGVITVTYNPRKQNGVFYKAIQVFSNAPEGVHIIIAKGVVNP